MIFIDTWAWVALADKSDPYHRKAKALHKKLTKAGRQYFTSDYVLGETITYLYDAIGPPQAQGFVNTLITAADSGTYQLAHVSVDQFRRAWKLPQKYQNKPDIRFVDFTLMIVMQDLGVAEVFTGDAHSLQVGLGFRIVP